MATSLPLFSNHHVVMCHCMSVRGKVAVDDGSHIASGRNVDNYMCFGGAYVIISYI